MSTWPEVALADDVETIQALRLAAEALDGLLIPENDGVQTLLLPDATWTVRPTGLDALPLDVVLDGAGNAIALPACGDHNTLRQVLLSWRLGETDAAFAAPAIEAPIGWDLLRGNPIRLERTNPLARGWPTSAKVLVNRGIATVQVQQTLYLTQPVIEQAIALLLPKITRPPVALRRLPAQDGAGIGDPALVPLLLAYELLLPTSLLTAELLGAALAAVAELYRQVAPVLEAFATHPALAHTFRSMNAPSHGVVAGPALPNSGG